MQLMKIFRLMGVVPSLKKACTGKADLCLTHNLWGALENHIEDFLVSVTVHDVISGKPK